ncbi:olfactory receptor 2K2-like [Sphaeramia orbicularis]|uniref:olfactory receptor 2K2-like n=1 Tax=Sphaeramia orbicularis TaxID=375764 RepID=UPI00117D30A1|nr:olfactory receptor 2K2-like [Sphaeramia orbicularis]
MANFITGKHSQPLKAASTVEMTKLLLMENITVVAPLKQPITFVLEGFYVPPGYGSLLFFLALLDFVVALLGNGTVILIIIIDRSLHRPMFVMICNLAVCDLLGVIAVTPRFMIHFLTGQRRIAYSHAIAQAFCVHTYGVAVQTILCAMAYDRYIAVCEPLRYHSIMTSTRLIFSCALAWFIALLCIGVLFYFHIDVPLCGNIIQHVYCSNRVILNLACGPTTVNNIYGLSMTWTLSTSVFIVIAFSYIKILQATVTKGKADSSIRSKAFQTCASHLVVYVLFEIAITIIVVSHRFPSMSQNIKQFCSILFAIIPPAVNPIIYGLVSTELRKSVIKLFRLTVTELRESSETAAKQTVTGDQPCLLTHLQEKEQKEEKEGEKRQQKYTTL